MDLMTKHIHDAIRHFTIDNLMAPNRLLMSPLGWRILLREVTQHVSYTGDLIHPLNTFAGCQIRIIERQKAAARLEYVGKVDLR